jgi:hypothetical protein
MCYEPDRMHRNHRMHCWRHFLTKEEKIQHLKEYKKWLENETIGVEEAINDLKKAS